LGPYGFLASPDVKTNGALNAGILDQHYALQWVQENIHLFGGNASHVTIWGESAGGGSIMLQTLAYGGTEKTELFQAAIGSSPYLPMQWGYNQYPSTVGFPYFLFSNQRVHL
jgi:carboxylesterase type B